MLTINNSTFSNNWSIMGGSAIYHYGGDGLNITNSTFNENVGSVGAVIYVSAIKYLNIINSKFYKN